MFQRRLKSGVAETDFTGLIFIFRFHHIEKIQTIYTLYEAGIKMDKSYKLY